MSDRRSTDRPWGDRLTLAKLLPTRESGHLVEKRSSKGGEPRGISAINETLRAIGGCLTVPAGETRWPEHISVLVHATADKPVTRQRPAAVTSVVACYR